MDFTNPYVLQAAINYKDGDRSCDYYGRCILSRHNDRIWDDGLPTRCRHCLRFDHRFGGYAKEFLHEIAHGKKKRQEKYCVARLIGSIVRHAIKNKRHGLSWESVIGYTLDDLIKHLESQFEDGMSWDNYGKWHIDHIKPVSSFNIESIEDEELKECWSLQNLQPLWARENFKKGAKVAEG